MSAPKPENRDFQIWQTLGREIRTDWDDRFLLPAPFCPSSKPDQIRSAAMATSGRRNGIGSLFLYVFDGGTAHDAPEGGQHYNRSDDGEGCRLLVEAGPRGQPDDRRLGEEQGSGD
jgi:hypothetical protein